MNYFVNNHQCVFSEINCKDEWDLRNFFLRNNITETTEQFNPFPLDEKTAHKIACENVSDYYCLARVHGEPFAFGMLRGWSEGYEIPSLGVLVDHEWRGRKIGENMTLFLLSIAKERGAKKVRLSVYKDNLKAKSLYEKFGFKNVDSNERNGKVSNIMVKELMET